MVFSRNYNVVVNPSTKDNDFDSKKAVAEQSNFTLNLKGHDLKDNSVNKLVTLFKCLEVGQESIKMKSILSTTSLKKS